MIHDPKTHAFGATAEKEAPQSLFMAQSVHLPPFAPTTFAFVRPSAEKTRCQEAVEGHLHRDEAEAIHGAVRPHAVKVHGLSTGGKGKAPEWVSC